MKTVTTPTFNNPFELTVNGRKYSYPPGKTVEVPDEVAEAIENITANIPKDGSDLGVITTEINDHSTDKQAASAAAVNRELKKVYAVIDDAMYADEDELIVQPITEFSGGATATSQGDGVLPPTPVVVPGG